MGFVSDAASDVYKLAKDMKVALPLHPEYETGPNIYYIPPFSGPSQVNADGSLLNVDRIPMDYLRFLFGSEVDAAIATLRDARDSGDPDGILAILSTNDRYQLGGQ